MNRTERRRLAKVAMRKWLRSPWRWWRQRNHPANPCGTTKNEIVGLMTQVFAECKR